MQIVVMGSWKGNRRSGVALGSGHASRTQWSIHLYVASSRSWWASRSLPTLRTCTAPFCFTASKLLALTNWPSVIRTSKFEAHVTLAL